MKLVGVVYAAVYIAVAGFFRGLGLPHLDCMSGGCGITGRHRVWSAAVQVHAYALYIFRGIRVAHGSRGEGKVARERLRHHYYIIETGGRKVRTQVGADETVKVRGRPEAGIVAGVIVRFVLDR